MRELYLQLDAMLREFIEQRDDLFLLVATGDGEGALILKALRDFDHESAGDLVLLFGEPFGGSDEFVDSIGARLREEIENANSVATEEHPPLPFPPEATYEPAVPAAVRLQFGLGYAASLVDPRGGQRYVWGMVPAEIKNPDGYVKLLAELARREPGEWSRGGRVIVRVPENFVLDKSPLAGLPRVRVERFEIPHDVHERGLLEMMKNPDIPEADRMGAAVQLGFIDVAHGRFGAATTHFNTTLAFFKWAAMPAMAGLVMVGLGDVARRQGNKLLAREWYESALVPAVESESPILLSNVIGNIAALGYEEGKYAEAAERYSELGTARRAMFDEDGVAEALEWEGNALEKNGKPQEAVFKWYEAALIGRTFGLDHRLATVLPSLKRGYETLGWDEAVRTFDDAWIPKGVRA